MSSSMVDVQLAAASRVKVTESLLIVALDDGRTISLPLHWYPRLLHGTPEERADFRLIGAGSGIHWELLDEDLRTEDLIAGKRSQESQASLKRWLDRRGTESGS